MKKFINIVILFLMTSFLFLPSYVLAEQPADPDKPRVVDNSNLLTDEAEQKLTEKIKNMGKTHSMDVVIVTTDTFDGKTPEAYADDYYDYNFYGYGPTKDGVLLVVNIVSRDWHISTTGKAIEYFNDDRVNLIGDTIRDSLSEAEYEKAFNSFLNVTSYFFENYPHQSSYDSNDDYKVVHSETRNKTTDVLIGAGICLVISGIVMAFMVFSMNNARKNNSAINYVESQGVHLTNSLDIFTHSHTSKTKKAQNSSSSGGTSTHTSSSGTTHGGGGGKF
ncbi:uncharacterized protein SAMN02745248_02176 [Hathewaya proteolytica DSM 3090]|uniref:TPM domain-containing protein n=1 Tax=Hathewaya proteolytica DSM 3090 TaxID=1121331 RepID=A0A1M6R239_9CLOT|nr:TPM domain-containing protein [Hathewaya proteolytica]SHK26514.1 uncharacterized protein SAMN02745248_02176 [Hathewaya proteolytica DSM 3090]